MTRANRQKGIVLINEETGERKDFKSINAAAQFLGVPFQAIQIGATTNGVRSGWRVYFDEKTIRVQIASLEAQLDDLKK